IRPEHLEDASLEEAPDGPRLRGTMTLREALGAEVMAHFTIDARPAVTDEVRELAHDAGGTAEDLEQGSGATLVGRFGAQSRVGAGEAVEAAIDTRALHFFDPDTGLGIYDERKGATS
nr:TOBE domain-containing protein [Actinomycetota bacterium]